MKEERRTGFKALAILLACALVQISLQLSFAAPSSSSPPEIPQGLLGRITVKGNTPITINAISANSGDTVATGAMVETPSGTEATVDLGPLGSVEFASATRARVDYVCPADRLGNPDPEMCQVNVTLFQGCVISNYRQGTRHKIEDDGRAKLAESDRDKEKNGGGVLRICHRAAAAAVASDGINWTGTKIGLLVAAIAVPTAIILIALGDDNPSPSSPS